MAAYPRGSMLHLASAYTVEDGQGCIICQKGIISDATQDPSKIIVTADGVEFLSFPAMGWLVISPSEDIWVVQDMGKAQKYGAKLCGEVPGDEKGED